MKAISIKVAFIVGCIIGAYILMLSGSFAYWTLVSVGSSPQIADQLKNKLLQLPTNDLLKKVDALENPLYPDYFSPYPKMALEILSLRGEKRVVPVLLKLLKSKKSRVRVKALSLLCNVKDPQAFNSLLNFFQSSKHDDFERSLALRALSYYQYEGVYPEIIKMTTSKNTVSSSIDMLINYPDKKEVIQLLQKIYETDPDPYIRDKAYFALEKIQQKKERGAGVKIFNK
jgi:hypothetical protein